MQSAALRTGGCDFAVDPSLRGDHVHPVWLPKHDAQLALVATAGLPLSDRALTLDLAALRLLYAAPEGDYHAGAARDSVDVLRLARDGPANSLLIPLDDLFADRLAVALRVWRATRRGKQPALPSSTSTQLRRRKLVLRALDARLAGATYREIALGLFGSRRVPDGSGWRQHHLRSLTIRLVQDGLDRLRGGYLRLLRPGRRDG